MASAGLPYVLLFITQGIAGMVADWLANTGRLSMTHVRKLFNTLGLLFAATFFGLLGSPIIQRGRCGRVDLTPAPLGLSPIVQPGRHGR